MIPFLISIDIYHATDCKHFITHSKKIANIKKSVNLLKIIEKIFLFHFNLFEAKLFHIIYFFSITI